MHILENLRNNNGSVFHTTILSQQKGAIIMQGLKQSELNWIREVVSAHNMTSCKLNTYSQQVQDPQIKQMFNQASTQAKQAAQNLLQML